MKNLLIAFTLLFAAAPSKAQSQDPWTAYMNPSSVHELLAQFTGDFKMEIAMSMGADQAPTKMTVSASHKLLLGGRFLEIKQQSEMMGMDYQAITTIGFNNADQKMALTTITNMGTATLSLYGDWNEKTRSANLFGQLTNPVSKAVINVRQKVTFIDNHTIRIESYDQEADKPEMKTVEYTFTRMQ